MSRGQRGFGILEVLISGTMLIIGLAAVTQFQGTAFAVMAKERRVVAATHVAEQIMERLIVMFPEQSELTDGSHTGPRYDDRAQVSPTGAFTTSWQVQVNNPVEGARRVTVEVRWLENGSPHTVVFSTIRT